MNHDSFVSIIFLLTLCFTICPNLILVVHVVYWMDNPFSELLHLLYYCYIFWSLYIIFIVYNYTSTNVYCIKRYRYMLYIGHFFRYCRGSNTSKLYAPFKIDSIQPNIFSSAEKVYWLNCFIVSLATCLVNVELVYLVTIKLSLDLFDGLQLKTSLVFQYFDLFWFVVHFSITE